jgi:type II secretory pathway component PulL
MRNKLLLLFVLLFLFASWTSAAARATAYQNGVHHYHRRVSQHYQRHLPHHQRYYIRHRSKLQHAKLIGGTTKTGMSVGSLIGGPPGMAVGAAAGAAVGTAYDLKTRKVKVRSSRS